MSVTHTEEKSAFEKWIEDPFNFNRPLKVWLVPVYWYVALPTMIIFCCAMLAAFVYFVPQLIGINLSGLAIKLVEWGFGVLKDMTFTLGGSLFVAAAMAFGFSEVKKTFWSWFWGIMSTVLFLFWI